MSHQQLARQKFSTLQSNRRNFPLVSPDQATAKLSNGIAQLCMSTRHRPYTNLADSHPAYRKVRVLATNLIDLRVTFCRKSGELSQHDPIELVRGKPEMRKFCAARACASGLTCFVQGSFHSHRSTTLQCLRG